MTVYISSHAGEDFIKIQDTDVITTEDLARALHEMHMKGRYRRLAIVLDTCRAITFFSNVQAPDVFMLASSSESEDAKSHTYNADIGTFTNDIFSNYFVQYMRSEYPAVAENATLLDLKNYLAAKVDSATVQYKSTFQGIDISDVHH